MASLWGLLDTDMEEGTDTIMGMMFIPDFDWRENRNAESHRGLPECEKSNSLLRQYVAMHKPVGFAIGIMRNNRTIH